MSILLTMVGAYITTAAAYEVMQRKEKELPIPILNHIKEKQTLKEVFTRTGAHVVDRAQGKIIIPKIKEFKKSHYGYSFHLILPDGMKPLDIINIRDEIAYAMGGGEVIINIDRRRINVEVYNRDLPKLVSYKPFNADLLKKYEIPLYLGESVRGEEYIDLVEIPHLLIGGETKGGKSRLLDLIINYLSHNRKVELYGIDFAAVELAYLEKYGVQIATTRDHAVFMLQTLTKAWNDRKQLFTKTGVVDIQEFNSLGHDLKYMVLIIDELSQFRARPGMDKDDKNDLLNALGQLTDLGSIGRKYGIHIIVATQKPTAEVIPSLLKDNIPGSIAFPIKTTQGSISILGHGGARYLPKTRGRCIWQWDGERLLQVAYLKKEDREKVIGYKQVYNRESPVYKL